MRVNIWKRFALVGTVALAMGLAHPSAARAGDPATPSRLTVSAVGGIDSLNPLLGTLSTSSRVFSLVYDTLNRRSDSDLSAVSGLATAWSTSPDGLSWTYRITSEARWSDGRPVTAEDAAFTFNLMMRNPAARTARGNFVATFDSVTAPDPATLVIRLKSPTATMLSLDVPILPAHLWRQIGDVGAFANDKLPLVGSGPYRLVEHRPGEYLRLVANKSYPLGAPKFDELVIRTFDNADAAVQALRRGDIDMLGDMTPAQFDALADYPGVTRNAARGARFVELVYNHGAARTDGSRFGDGSRLLTDRRVRQAIDLAIDRQALVDAVLGGHGEIGGGYLPPVFGEFQWQPEAAVRRAHDPAGADRLLDEAGLRRGPNGMRRHPDGAPVILRLHAPTSRPYFAPSAEHITQWLKRAGIAIDLKVMPLTQVNEAITAGRFDLYLTAWGVGPEPDDVLSVHTCDRRPAPGATTGSSDAFYCDARYDKLYRRQLTEVDPPRRAAVVRQLQRRLYEDVAVSTLFYPDSLEAYRSDRVGSVVARPTSGRGSIIGPWAYVAAVPVHRASSPGARLPWLGGAAAVGVVVLGVLWWRRRGADDRR